MDGRFDQSSTVHPAIGLGTHSICLEENRRTARPSGLVSVVLMAHLYTPMLIEVSWPTTLQATGFQLLRGICSWTRGAGKVFKQASKQTKKQASLGFK